MLYTASSAFSILIIMFFIRKLFLWSHIISFFSLNAAIIHVPVNIKYKIYILVSLTVRWKGVYVCLYSNMEGTYIFLLKSIVLTVWTWFSLYPPNFFNTHWYVVLEITVYQGNRDISILMRLLLLVGKKGHVELLSHEKFFIISHQM